MVQIKPVVTQADWEKFVDLPWKIYEGDQFWVPPLRMAVRDTLDVSKNPFFKHALMWPMLAYRDGSCIGRIVGIVDESHNRYHEEKTAFFGFFECLNDQEVANALLDEVARWARSQGMNLLRGPMNPSTNHEAGLLVEGFADTPSVMMTYNPRYYEKLLEVWGLTKAKDLLAYVIKSDAKFSDKVLAHSERLKRKGTVTFRTPNMRNFEAEVDLILDIYNDAWEKNWGFVPMTPEEFRHLAKDLKMVLDPELLLIAEVRGQPAGFSLALPDINLALKKVSDGRLFPTGLMKLLWHLKGPVRRRTVNRCRIITLGIKKAYREVGIGALLYTEYLRRGPAMGYMSGEASWILEDNIAMNKALQLICGERTKVYRIYDKGL